MSNVIIEVADDIDVDQWTGLGESPCEQRRARNLDAFEKRYPELHAQLKAHRPGSELVETEDGDLNVVFSGVTLYRRGAREDTRAQLDSYWQEPRRMLLAPVQLSAVDKHAGEFLQGYVEEAVNRQISFSVVPQDRTAYHAVVLGVGLGAHLNELLETIRCRNLLLVEPNMEFLHHSLDVFDWEGFFARAKEIGCRPKFIVTSDPNQAGDRIRGLIRASNPMGLDGTYTYVHYKNAVFENILSRLDETWRVTLAGLGFFEDELAMIRQTTHNLKTGTRKIMRTDRSRVMRLPVFIVANGPSLDHALEFLAENQHKAVIIACGTAAEPMLKFGIRPDFQMAMERGEPQLVKFTALSERNDLSDICLVASTTIYPGLAELFDETIFFFRPGLTPLPLYCDDPRQMLLHPDPIVANAALSFSQESGFREFYFFGLDMGKKVGAHHHSEHATLKRNPLEDSVKYNIPIRGAQGGTVMGAYAFFWSKSAFETALAAYSRGRLYYNCSGGADIRGTMPRHVSTLKIPDPPRDKTTLVRELIESMPTYPRETLERRWREADLRHALHTFCDKLLRAMEVEPSLRDRGYVERVMPLMDPLHVRAVLPVMCRGTVYQTILAGEYYMRRAIGEAERETMETLLREGFEMVVERMRREGLEMIDEVEEMLALEPA